MNEFTDASPANFTFSSNKNLPRIWDLKVYLQTSNYSIFMKKVV